MEVTQRSRRRQKLFSGSLERSFYVPAAGSSKALRSFVFSFALAMLSTENAASFSSLCSVHVVAKRNACQTFPLTNDPVKSCVRRQRILQLLYADDEDDKEASSDDLEWTDDIEKFNSTLPSSKLGANLEASSTTAFFASSNSLPSILLPEDDEDYDDEELFLLPSKKVLLSKASDASSPTILISPSFSGKSHKTRTTSAELNKREEVTTSTKNGQSRDTPRPDAPTKVIWRGKGVGRNGYNLTLLALCNYDLPTYHSKYQQQLWESRIGLIADFKDKHGHMNIPFRYTVNVTDADSTMREIKLGQWLTWKRSLYRQDSNLLPALYVKKLKNMGMNWEGVGVGRRPDAFQTRLDELHAFRQEYGHCNVPQKWSQNQKLALWTEKQRSLYKLKMQGRSSQLTNERIDAMRNIGFDFDRTFAKNNQRQKEDGLRAVLHVKFVQDWTEMLQRLEAYKDERGDTDVPLNYSSDEPLGYWVYEQCWQFHLLERTDLGPCLLSKERIHSLADLGFNFSLYDWGLIPVEDIANKAFDWQVMIVLLKQYHAANGDCDISLTSVDSERDANLILLYSFARRMRWEFRNRHTHAVEKVNGTANHIKKDEWSIDDKERIKVLDDLGFVWERNETTKTTTLLKSVYDWWDYYHDLVRYKAANGHLLLQATTDTWYSGQLSLWARKQKDGYIDLSSGHDGCANETWSSLLLTEWHYSQLSHIGFFNDGNSFSSFSRDVISNFRKIEPRFAGRKPALFELLPIDRFANKINATMSSSVFRGGRRSRKAQLDELVWHSFYEELFKHQSKYGIGKTLDKDDDDPSVQRLAFWVHNQRVQYKNYCEGKKTTMTQSRIQLLNDIDFDWQPYSTKSNWDDMLTALQLFKKKHGNCYVPAVYPSNLELGQWVLRLRDEYQQSKMVKQYGNSSSSSILTDEAVHTLLSLGLDLTMDHFSFGQMAYQSLWNARIEELRDYRTKHGHCNVSQLDFYGPYFELALWVKELRALNLQRKESLFTPERRAELENLGFRWNVETSEE